MPDLGMIWLTQFLEQQTQFGDLFSVGLLFFVITIIQGISGHWHRMTLTNSIVKGLRDLRQDLFEHLRDTTQPSLQQGAGWEADDQELLTMSRPSLRC